MALIVKRRGFTSSAGANGDTPRERELIIDQQKKEIRLGDGATAGGIPIARADMDNVLESTLATKLDTTLSAIDTNIADTAKINTLDEKETLVDNDLFGGENSASDPVFGRIKVKSLSVWNYIKSKIQSEAGMVIGYAYEELDEDVSTTSSGGATVLTISYTPKKDDSLLEIEFVSGSATISNDYGSTAGNFNLTNELRLREGETILATGGLSYTGGASRTSGATVIGGDIKTKAIVASTGTTERTFNTLLRSLGDNKLTTCFASNGTYLIIREIAQ